MLELDLDIGISVADPDSGSNIFLTNKTCS
jgi:hypothetical protein